MNRHRWLLVIATCLLLLGSFPVVILTKASSVPSGTGRASGQSAMEGVPDKPLERRRRAPAKERKNTPFASLSPKLKRLVADLETRAQFLVADEGFTAEQHEAAREGIMEAILSLSLGEIKALTEFYENPENDRLFLNGDQLSWLPLLEARGVLDPASAVAEMANDIREWSEKPGEVRDLLDPFTESSGPDEVASVFKGWASVDADAALQGWQKHYETHLKDNPRVKSAEALDANVREAIAKGSASSGQDAAE